ncbi:hypothetical protein M3M35_01365 [Fructilactobacillus myrtifloralis]|uniref:ABC-2 type transporter domain-containing protein n=1 Tax=Fructilactobacillus myrtifloralis TaxID=2940301 RepID=A0ABY5BQZ4_9LACO|nr:hypothetical protein [Fructilactobacillus myrtifloralis]USS85341.1 hypothetical protein M3M35_01365 [Fructilactobacillus myrtifloralis]
MNNYLILKMTFRNRRFLFFTLITPILWYLGMHFYETVYQVKSNGSLLMVTCAITIGIAGNSLVTFAKSVNYTKDFYLLQIETSPYTIRKWLSDDILVQAILNLVIASVVIICGLGIGDYPLSANLVVLLVLMLYLGAYLSLFGFLIGQWFDAQTLDATSFFLMLVVMFFLIPFYKFAGQNIWIKAITTLQQLFPPYYVYQTISHAIGSSGWWASLGLLVVVSFGSGLPALYCIQRLLSKDLA